MKNHRSILVTALLSMACTGGGSDGGEFESPAGPDAGDQGEGPDDNEIPRAANGNLRPWTAQPSLPEPRVNHCSARAGNLVIVAGGNYRPQGADAHLRLNTIVASEIGADGGLSEWQVIGTTPSAVQECILIADDTRLLLIAGNYEDPLHSGKVWTSILSTTDEVSDASLTEWSNMGSLPSSDESLLLNNSKAWLTSENVLVVSGSTLPQASDVSFLVRAPIENDSLGVWEMDVWSDAFRYQSGYAKVGSYVYRVGGYGLEDETNVVYSDSYAIELASDGAVIDTFESSPLPVATAFGEALGVDDVVFVVGGRDKIIGGTRSASALAATVLADGSLSEWTETEPLPVSISNHDLVVGPSHLYSIGGGTSDAQLSDVYAAHARFPIEEEISVE